jgi:hypothetical protein
MKINNKLNYKFNEFKFYKIIKFYYKRLFILLKILAKITYWPKFI